MMRGHNIICFGFAEWDNPYRTNQHHLMERFSRENRVLFIESLGLRRPTLQKKDLRRMVKRLAKWFRGVRKVNGNLHVLSPLVIPFHKYRAVRAVNRVLLRFQLRTAVAALNLKDPILWSYIPSAIDYLGVFKEKMSVYHCVDELTANPLIPGEVVEALEKKFMAAVTAVFTTSKSLYESKKPFNRRTYYLPNVAEFDHFNRATLPDTRVPEEIGQISGPRIGFIGALSAYKIDFSLIADIASRRPEWSFILVGALGEGEKAADLQELARLKNIHIFPGRPYVQLPGILKGLDVCLLPNILNEYTRNMFPMKFFEYLSAGKPVVSTRLDALKDFEASCYLSDRRDFEGNIERALNEHDPEKVRQRISLAQRYTWETRIREMGEILFAPSSRG